MTKFAHPIATFPDGLLTPYTAGAIKGLIVFSLLISFPDPSPLSVALYSLYVALMVMLYLNIRKRQKVPAVKVFPDRIEIFRGFPFQPRLISLHNVCSVDQSNIQKFFLVTSDNHRYAIHRRMFAFNDRLKFIAVVEGLLQSHETHRTQRIGNAS